MGFLPTLPKNSYLKIDSYYEVHIDMLVGVKDYSGNLLSILPKHRGGVGELRDYVRRRDLIRENKRLCLLAERQGEETVSE